MAENKPVLPQVVVLPPESRKVLEEMGPVNARLKQDFETLKKLGIDVSAVAEKLEWAESARKILLENFK